MLREELGLRDSAVLSLVSRHHRKRSWVPNSLLGKHQSGGWALKKDGHEFEY